MKFFYDLFKWKKYNDIDGEELKEMIKNDKKLILLDVRSKGEHSSFNIPKSKNIPLGELSSSLDKLKSYKDRKIVVYCASGARSRSGAKILTKNGFESVYNLKGGVYSYKK